MKRKHVTISEESYDKIRELAYEKRVKMKEILDDVIKEL